MSYYGYRNPYAKVYRDFYSGKDDTVLPCGYTVGQSWTCLKKAWKGYKISKAEGDLEKMKLYASIIQKVQKELGTRIIDFPNLKMYDFGQDLGYIPDTG